MAKVIPLHRPEPAAEIGCSSCGAIVDAACDCGVAYVPARERAAAAVQKSPGKSNRAIAAEIGVDHKTVAKARGDNSPPERVTGKDGKSYPAKARQTPQAELLDSDGRIISTDPKVIMKALRDDVFLPDGGDWEKLEVPSDLVTLARQAAKEWTEIATDLAQRHDTAIPPTPPY